MGQRIDVMISSTARDLPEHRKQAMEAILRMSMHPIGMEHLPAKSEDAIDASFKMVDEAEIYLGIFAHRYGYIPESPKNPDKLSITELEYHRAVKRDIPRLIFIMGDDHPLSAKDLETDPDGSAKLLRFKNELKTSYVVSFFNSPEQLREQVITALAHYRQSDVAQLHYISDIPKLPEPYIAHPYTLLQTSQLFGRQAELNLLTDWVAKPDSEVYQARILNIVAIGGMGKSALTWKWFNDIAPQEMKPLAGRMWWSFYESDASFENFVIRALAYVTQTPREDIEALNPIERENALLKALNEKPFLLVLDGLERILVAYARMDAAYLKDDDLDEQTANRVAGALGLPESAGQSFVGQHLLRKTADPRAGNFLRKLANLKQSRVLVSTRLYPADLQTITGGFIPGSFASFLMGLGDDDALALWRAMGVSGSRDALLPMFKTFDNYPLLIRALAGEVARFRKAPGDFDEWHKKHPDFNPISLPLVQVKSHILAYALQGLSEAERKVLHTVAAFRMPATYDTLSALLVGNDKLYQAEQKLDEVLSDLEDRGLLGWDKRANRYDLHPIVRGVIWNLLSKVERKHYYEQFEMYFQSIPKINEINVKSIEDLTPNIELFNALIELERYDAAYNEFYDNMRRHTHYRLSANKQRIEMLERMFPNGINKLPRPLGQPGIQAVILNALAVSYFFTGRCQEAKDLLRRYISMSIMRNSSREVHTGFCNLSDVLRVTGELREAELLARHSLNTAMKEDFVSRRAVSLDKLGLVWSIIHKQHATTKQNEPLYMALKIFNEVEDPMSAGFVCAYLAETALWHENFKQAHQFAQESWDLAHHVSNERDFIRAARLLGKTSLYLGNYNEAIEWLNHAVTRARSVSFSEEEIAALVALSELDHQQGNLSSAYEHLGDTWEMSERGSFRLIHSDGMNVLAQIERDEGNIDKAVEAATQAYKLAWCDGISEDGKQCYAYWWGLQKAKKHLEELGAPIPQLPYFDESKHEPLPEIDWDKLFKGEDLHEHNGD